MSKNKNQRIWSSDLELLKRLADEQENYIGRDFKLDLVAGCITIFALPRRYKKKDKEKAKRNKRNEKFERHER